jgi:formylglycine-generating enzyme required for sulfatase activity
MSDFFKKFLLEDARRFGAASGSQVFLGAFGKHPGWDDHIEDLGLETDSLIFAKTLLYVQGIGSQIDSGGWEKLEANQQIPAFKHVFLWRRGNQFLLGRLWSSSDGKGRSRYPMIVCAHCLGLPLAQALPEILPRLARIEQDCLMTKSAEDVRLLVKRHREELRAALLGTQARPPGGAAPGVTTDALAAFVAHPSLGPGFEGWFRILYQMDSQMSAFTPGTFTLRGDSLKVRPQQMRLPVCAPSLAETLLLWNRFFQDQVDPMVPILAMVPLEEGWLDVTLGEPTPHEFFCLRVSPRKLPLSNEVPYTIAAEFRERAKTYLAALQRNESAPVSQKKTGTGTTTLTAKPGAAKPKWLRWLVGGAGLLLVGALVTAVLLSAGKNSNQNRTEVPPPSNAVASLAPPGPGVQSDRPVPTQSQPSASTAAKTSPPAPPSNPPAAAVTPPPKTEPPVAPVAVPPPSPPPETLRAQAEEAARLKKAEEEKAAQEAQRLAEARRLAEEQAKAAEAARLQAEAEAREKARLAAARQKDSKAAETTDATAGTATAGQGTGPRLMTNGIGMELVWLAGGVWVGKYEVTQGEYEKVMGSNPSRYKGNARLPVDSVSWSEAIEFCRKLTALEKQSGKLPVRSLYTLPTQKQWESFLADADLNQAVTSRAQHRREPLPVGSAKPNRLGLHDLLGNVWEWCLDGAGGNERERTLMGGSFTTAKIYNFKPFTPDTSQSLAPESKLSDAGFRCLILSLK